MKRLLLTLFVAALIAGTLAGGFLYVFSRTPYGDSTQELHIARGTPLNQIITVLAEHHVISSVPLFRTYLYVQGVAHRVRAGDYTFTPGLTPKEVVAMLLKGDFKTYRFTIPEGWNQNQIAAYLEQEGLTDAESFLAATRDPNLIAGLGLHIKNLEGFLYPSTYETYHPKGPEALIGLMVKGFQEVYTAEMQARAKQLNLTVSEVVTLASIVEKETGKAEERPLIASVFHNRLSRGMPLQSDPTVIYGIEDFDGNLTRRHLESYTPYNTYMVGGLPPGPIANPGKASLLSALYPADTEYLYFVSKNDGSHDFSKTLSEHQEKVIRYQIRGK